MNDFADREFEPLTDAEIQPLLEQRYSGQVARVVTALSSTRFEEMYVLSLRPDNVDVEYVRDYWPDALLLDVFDFVDQPKVLPAALYERDFSTELPEAEVLARFLGEPKTSPDPRKATESTAAAVDLPMFWRLVGTLGGELDEGAVIALMDELEKLPPAQVQAFARILHEQVQPLADEATANGDEYYSADISEYWAASVLAHGEQVYEQVLQSEGPVHIGEESMIGENLILAIDQLAEQTAQPEDADSQPTGPQPLNPKVVQWHLFKDAGYRDIEDPLADAFYNANVVGTWYSGRTLCLLPNGQYRESVIALTIPAVKSRTLDPTTEWSTAAHDYAQALNARLIATDGPHDMHAWIDDHEGLLFLTRREPAGLDAYLDRYFHYLP